MSRPPAPTASAADQRSWKARSPARKSGTRRKPSNQTKPTAPHGRPAPRAGARACRSAPGRRDRCARPSGEGSGGAPTPRRARRPSRRAAADGRRSRGSARAGHRFSRTTGTPSRGGRAGAEAPRRTRDSGGRRRSRCTRWLRRIGPRSAPRSCRRRDMFSMARVSGSVSGWLRRMPRVSEAITSGQGAGPAATRVTVPATDFCQTSAEGAPASMIRRLPSSAARRSRMSRE